MLVRTSPTDDTRRASRTSAATDQMRSVKVRAMSFILGALYGLVKARFPQSDSR
jgi:hypothetical protein